MKLKTKKTAIISGISVVAASTLAFAGCTSFSGTDTSNQEVEARDYQSFMTHTAEVYKDYVTLGEYKGLNATAVDRSSEEITDETVESVISELISATTTTEDVTEDGVTQEGDTIVLSYEGTIDGEAFDGGTASDYSYTVGSGAFITDLDEGLVGLSANQDYDIPVTFPEDYSSEDLQGKAAVFKVNISSITRSVTPEANDEWVKANQQLLSNYGYGTPSTLDELKANIKETQAQQAKESNDVTEFETVYEEILANSEITGYPEEEKEALVSTYTSNIESQYSSYGSYYGVESYEEYIEQVYGMTEDEFSEYIVEQTETYLAKKMIITLIAAENNIQVSTDDITFLGGTLAAYYGYDDYNAIISAYGKVINCELGYQSLTNKVASYIVSVSNEVEETEAESTDSESTDTTESTDETEATEASSEEDSETSETTTTE